MNRTQVFFNLLKNQAQALFWKYTATSEALASRIAVSAYKASFLEFLQYVSEQHHLKKITQVRKKHVDGYIAYLSRDNNSDFLIAKRVYAICFWLSMIADRPERFPQYDSFGFR